MTVTQDWYIGCPTSTAARKRPTHVKPNRVKTWPRSGARVRANPITKRVEDYRRLVITYLIKITAKL